jgi:hypothetical protein
VSSTTVVPVVEESTPNSDGGDANDSVVGVAPAEAEPIEAEPVETEPVEEVTLATIGARRAEALADVDGFTATHTTESLRRNRTFADVQEITAMADGRVWTQDDRGSWSSIDPASGLYRAAYVDGVGGALYQELTDRTGFAVDGIVLAMGGGTDPTAPIDAYDDDGVTIEHTSHERRAAWKVFARGESDEHDIQTETTWVVDVETGLLVDYTFSKWEDGQDGDEDRFRSTLTNLRAADELPADFPRQFPDDAVVDDDPGFDFSGGRRRVTLEQAASEFSVGLVAPADLPADATVTLYDHTIDNSGTSLSPDHEEVTIITRRGFDVVTITVTKFIPIDGLTLTVGDVECYDFDEDDLCDVFGVQDTIEKGALSGRQVRIGGGGVTVADAGGTIEITDSNPERARDLADAFVNI